MNQAAKIIFTVYLLIYTFAFIFGCMFMPDTFNYLLNLCSLDQEWCKSGMLNYSMYHVIGFWMSSLMIFIAGSSYMVSLILILLYIFTFAINKIYKYLAIAWIAFNGLLFFISQFLFFNKKYLTNMSQDLKINLMLLTPFVLILISLIILWTYYLNNNNSLEKNKR